MIIILQIYSYSRYWRNTLKWFSHCFIGDFEKIPGRDSPWAKYQKKLKSWVVLFHHNSQENIKIPNKEISQIINQQWKKIIKFYTKTPKIVKKFKQFSKKVQTIFEQV